MYGHRSDFNLYFKFVTLMFYTNKFIDTYIDFDLSISKYITHNIGPNLNQPSHVPDNDCFLYLYDCT